tara:strand:+ start:1041 stop:1232 length:192 start_codon:yes stop_codon:yes gene_type:complete
MDIKTFNKAKDILEKINQLEIDQQKIQSIQKRRHDVDLNFLRVTAYNALEFQIGVYKSDFKNL